MGPSVHGDSKHPSFQMTVVLLRILSGLPTSAPCAHHRLHSHASFPTSQNAFPPRLTFYSYNNTKKKTEKDEQYLHLTEQSTPGCCFPYLPLQVTCYPLNRLNPREERYRSRFFPNGIIAMTPWPGPQMPAFNSSSLPYNEGSPWRDRFPLRTRQIPFSLSCPTPISIPTPIHLSPGLFPSLWGEFCPASSTAETERWSAFDLRSGEQMEIETKQFLPDLGGNSQGLPSGPLTLCCHHRHPLFYPPKYW